MSTPVPPSDQAPAAYDPSLFRQCEDGGHAPFAEGAATCHCGFRKFDQAPADQAGEQRQPDRGDVNEWWTTHASVKRDVENALMWLHRCEAEQTATYVHDAISQLVFIPQDLDHLQAERDSWRRAYKGACQNAEASERERDELRERIEHKHDFSAGPNCLTCGLHASTVEGGALSPEVITAKLKAGQTVQVTSRGEDGQS